MNPWSVASLAAALRDRFRRHPGLQALLLGAAGALLNVLALPPLPALPLYLGGVAYLFALLTLGWRWGLVAAALAGAALYGKGMLVLPLLETAVLAWLILRWHFKPWKAALVFWALLGMPFMALAGRSVAGLDWPILLTGMAVSGLNGMFNLLLAELLMGVTGRKGGEPLRVQFMRRLTLFAILPTLVLSIVFNHLEVRQRLVQQVQRLDHSLAIVRQRLDARVEDLIRHLDALAVAALRPGMADRPEQWNLLLEDAYRIETGLGTLLLADAQGIIQAGYPARFEDGRAVAGAGFSVADRAYFREPMRTGRAYVSDVFMGRGYGPKPIVAVSTPLVGGDGQIGVVEASLALAELTDLVQGAAQEPERVSTLITDTQGRVIYASEALGLAFMAALPETLVRIAERPAATPDALAAGDTRPYLYQSRLLRHAATRATRWRVAQLYDIRGDILYFNLRSLLRITVVLVLILAARVLAKRYADRVLEPLAQLNRRTESLNLVDIAQVMPVVVDHGPREVMRLVRTFNAMIARLSKAQLEIRSAFAVRDQLNLALERSNRELEDKVAERTEQLHQKAAMLEQLSITDTLTGLHNRRYLMREMQREWRRGQRLGGVLSLLLLDIDYFKRINDSHGHAAGDAVLVAVAAALRESLRETDTVARLGGEEFVILLPGVDRSGALQFAERLRVRVETLAIAFESLELACTVSIGLVDSQLAGLEDEEGMLLAADKALYTAKESGRNRVCAWPLAPTAA